MADMILDGGQGLQMVALSSGDTKENNSTGFAASALHPSHRCIPVVLQWEEEMYFVVLQWEEEEIGVGKEDEV